ncbi:MAG: undecaprenyldiphospho-muramoylpentapeptide beta-N-acetylglucosaminyltransferase [Tissierellia bacterium]|nr:undecaprenyldiphospho-muramoylpentapeptide beta-N-acetylglucosaminyltransferase [Tissierellia bacterium]
MRYLITGGGTGGHIYPALAIAKEIENRHRDAEILYVGTAKGLESELVPREGLDFKAIRVRGMPRKIGKDMLLAIKELALGINDARRIIKEYRPDIVIGTGGYVCGPVVYIASRRGIPTVIHEQNAFPGVTNKILSRFVDRTLITFEESRGYFKHPERVLVTGNPIRGDLMEVDRDKAYMELEISRNIPVVLSFGGSGGQRSLNEAMLHVIEMNATKHNMQIIHVTGNRFYDEFMQDIELMGIELGKNIRIMPYFYDMPKGLNIADLIITSAGAITLAEVSAIGIPSILIPKGYTAENHQEYNARAFEDEGAAHLILEADLTGENLNESIYEIIYDREKLSSMARNSRRMGRLDAAEEIVDIIDDLTR